MVAIIGNNPITRLKEGAVLTVTDANNEDQAAREIADLLKVSQRQDLGYFQISKDFFLLYPKLKKATNEVF